MKKLLYILFLLVGLCSYGQTVTQTYYDKCTGETKVFVIPTQGSTVVVYYNKTMSVSYNDVQSGAFQAWLEATYQWWTTYNPCSAAQATQTVVQQTTTQATQAATSAATSAASTATSSVTTSSTSGDVSSSSTTSSNSETSTTSESSSSSESSSKSESSSSKTEEKKEETKQESKKEEKKEEKKEDKKEDKKKQQGAQPVLIAANYMTMQNIDGSFNQVASFGLSQSSLTGETSYNANTMIWSNLKQFSLSLSKTTLLFNYDKKVPVKVGKEILGYKYIKGSLYKITGISATAMLMFNTKVLSLGMNDIFLLKKGLVVGYAFGTTFINNDEDVTISPSATFFATKPFAFKRYTISPMIATSLSPISYTSLAKKFTFSQYFIYIIGSNFDFNLTKRFKANLGLNTINSTNKEIPMTYAITIGSKFKF